MSGLANAGALTVSEVSHLYTHLWRASAHGRYCPVLVWGESGIGKSQSVKETAEKLGIGFKDLRLAFFEAPDLLGVPRLQEVYPCCFDFETENRIGMGRRFTRGALWSRIRDRYVDRLPHEMMDDPDRAVQFAIDRAQSLGLGHLTSIKTVNSPPGWLPQPGTAGLLFLDEVNRSQRDTRAGVFQLLLDRRIGESDLPSRWIIVAAVNPPASADENGSGGYEVAQLSDKAFLSRFCHVGMRPSLSSWIDYARKTRIDPRLRAFVAQGGPKALGSDRPVEVPDPDPTPRSWTLLSRIIADVPPEVPGGRPHQLDPDLVPTVAVGLVGLHATQTWLAMRVVPDPIVGLADIIADPEAARRRLVKFLSYPIYDAETGQPMLGDDGKMLLSRRSDLVRATFEDVGVSVEELAKAAAAAAVADPNAPPDPARRETTAAALALLQWGLMPEDRGGLQMRDVATQFFKMWGMKFPNVSTKPSRPTNEKDAQAWDEYQVIFRRYGVDMKAILTILAEQQKLLQKK